MQRVEPCENSAARAVITNVLGRSYFLNTMGALLLWRQICQRRFPTMRYVWQSVRALVACFLVTIFAVPPSLVAQSHVVSPADLQNEMVANTEARQIKLHTDRHVFTYPRESNALSS